MGVGGTRWRTWDCPNRRGGDSVSTISLLGCTTSVALATGPTDEEEVIAFQMVVREEILEFVLGELCFIYVNSTTGIVLGVVKCREKRL